RVFEQEKAVLFAVKDHGPGIPPEIKDTLFEPFATANKHKGTGLGLFIVKNIVEAHKGTVSFETGPQGTEFFIRIPKSVPKMK
ncbi:MAG: HAMP domain-containing histidine kinase, partial [bacterium]|nr:HAMP domain-containing histidine kinase [bacterium]